MTTNAKRVSPDAIVKMTAAAIKKPITGQNVIIFAA